MTVSRRCRHSAAIVEQLLDGQPPTAEQRNHLGGCAVCSRVAARVPALERAIAAAAGDAAGTVRIPDRATDPAIMEPAVGPARSRSWRLAGVGAVAFAAVLTAVGLGLVRSGVEPAPAAPDVTPAGIGQRIEALGLTCAEKTLNAYSTPPLIGQVCKAPELDGMQRSAYAWTDAHGTTRLEATAMVASRDSSDQVQHATRYLLDAAATVVLDPVELTTAQGFLAMELSDLLHPHDNRLTVGDRLVELEGSWSQGFTVTIGPAT